MTENGDSPGYIMGRQMAREVMDFTEAQDQPPRFLFDDCGLFSLSDDEIKKWFLDNKGYVPELVLKNKKVMAAFTENSRQVSEGLPDVIIKRLGAKQPK